MSLLRRSLLFLVALAAACGDTSPPPNPKPASGPAVGAQGDENPDAGRWVDLASRPFEPRWVGGELVRAIKPPVSLNSVVAGDVPKVYKFHLGTPLLIEAPDRVNGDVVLRPYGAASLPEVSADGLSQTWTLRGDLTWEDGHAVTASDFVFTFGMIKNPAVASELAASFEALERVEAVSPLVVRSVWSRRTFREVASFGLGFYLAAAHAMPRDAVAFAAAKTTLSCGPYRVASSTTERLVLDLRPEYRTKPFPPLPHYLARIVLQTPRDAAVAYTDVVNGSVHLAAVSEERWLASTTPAFRAAAWRTHVRIPFYTFIAWNSRDPADPTGVRPHPILGDVRVRQALSHLLPLQKLADALFHGAATVVTGPFMPGDAAEDPALVPRAHDPARARALLGEAGFQPGPGGALMRGTQPFRLSLLRFDGGHQLFADVLQTLKQEASQIGATIDLQVVTFADLLERAKTHQCDGTVMSWQSDFVQPELRPQWHSSFATAHSNNYAGFADAAADAAIEAFESAATPAARGAAGRALHRRLFEQAPATFLFVTPTPVLLSRRVANARVHDLGLRFADFVMRDLWERFPPR